MLPDFEEVAGEGGAQEVCPQPSLGTPSAGAPTPAARLQDTQKGALAAEVGVSPLGYSSTKQRALTDRAPPPAVLGPGGDGQVPAAQPDL